ncbi:hypothetical protein ACIPY6_28805 [Streptomyces sp. NPDC090054]|uniref:hypothetical protein n=1 Tax=Streptomyces sp. NPDC090054 TaxID=3365933 RepID=UPI00380311CC
MGDLMAKTGPQKYPPASLAYWWQNAFPGNAMESNVGVIHTTEGRTLPDYRGGRDAPNFTAVPDIPNRRLRWFQHFDFDVSSRALMNLAGGVQTNTANAMQVELVGTCDERNSVTWGGKRAGVDYIFWPDAPEWALAELAEFVRWSHDNHQIPMQSSVVWKAYKRGQTGGSYGANGVRLSGEQWNRYYGWLGHQHVPENDHGDPGNINFARVLALASGTEPVTPNPSPIEEDDMSTTLSQERSDSWNGMIWGLKYNAEEILARVTSQGATIDTLVKLVAADQDLDVAAVAAAVKKAVSEALAASAVKVDVTVQDKTTPKAS